jgi:hypothetical protein
VGGTVVESGICFREEGITVILNPLAIFKILVVGKAIF